MVTKLVQTRSWIGWVATQRSGGGKHQKKENKRKGQKLLKLQQESEYKV